MGATALDIPLQPLRDLADVERSHVSFRVAHDDPGLGYELRVPRSFKYSRELGASAVGLFEAQPLGSFSPRREGGSATISVSATHLPFEIPIDTWGQLAIVRQGFHIVCAEWRPGLRGSFFDITAARDDGVHVQLRRVTLRADAGRIFMVSCACRGAEWETNKETFWLAHLSFRLLSGSGQSRMEPWSKAVGRGPVFIVAHPQSWSARSVATSSDRVSGIDVKLLDEHSEELLAYVQVRASSSAQPAELARLEAAAAARLARAGVQLTGAREWLACAADPRAGAVEGWLGSSLGHGEVAGTATWVRLGWLQRSGRLLSFVALSPLLSRAPLTALRCQRAFEIARASVQLGS